MILESKADSYGQYIDMTIAGVIMRFRRIQPGSFMMGSPESERWSDEVLHEVTLPKGFCLADTVCTQKQWEAVMGDNPSYYKGEKRPAENVSWEDCLVFLERINSQMPGFDFRLPTEAEWEYACRAGTQTPFSFGDNLTTDQANYNGDYPYNNGPKGKHRIGTVEVESFPCNDWGLYDMHGNVWEWCSDWYGEYPTGSVTDPAGPDDGPLRVLRGGSWNFSAQSCRSAYRYCGYPGCRFDDVGFRLVFVP